MKLSEAIRLGSMLRGESHDGPFVRIANTEELRSDVWGAACEAVHSPVAKRNWNRANDDEYRADIAYLKEIQEKYFANYFKSPANCPGAKPRGYSKAGGRFTGRVVQGLNEFVIEREVPGTLGPITNICSEVMNLAVAIEHCFYVHNWSREDCAEAVQQYEIDGSTSWLERNFVHYQDDQLWRRISEKLTATARVRELQRHQRRVHFTN